LAFENIEGQRDRHEPSTPSGPLLNEQSGKKPLRIQNLSGYCFIEGSKKTFQDSSIRLASRLASQFRRNEMLSKVQLMNFIFNKTTDLSNVKFLNEQLMNKRSPGYVLPAKEKC
jgi:hypothetical protein